MPSPRKYAKRVSCFFSACLRLPDAKAPWFTAKTDSASSTADRVLNLEDASSQQRTSQTPHDSHSAVSIASVSGDTDVPARSGSKGVSPPGNHVPDASYNASYAFTLAQVCVRCQRFSGAFLPLRCGNTTVLPLGNGNGKESSSISEKKRKKFIPRGFSRPSPLLLPD